MQHLKKSEVVGKTAYLLTVCLLVYGCATPFQGNGMLGGYSDTKIQEGIYRINFKGNGYTSNARASDFTLLHAAEVALADGYNFFVIMEGQEDTETIALTTPVTAQTNGNVNLVTRNYGSGVAGSPYITSGTYSGRTSYSGGQTFNIQKPRATLLIQCFRELPTGMSGVVYDAQQVRDNLRTQYGIRPVYQSASE